MPRLIIHEDAFRLGIAHPIACIIDNVNVSTESSSLLSEEIEALMRTVTNEPETILSRPEVRGFNELFTRMGYPKQTPAGQRLIESFRRRGFKSFNNVVDAYNIVSALFGSGLGMHDASQIEDDVHVFRARGTEQIIPLFKSDPVKVSEGDLVYGANGRLLAWLGKRDVDSDEFKVSDNTQALLFIVLGNSATSEEYNRQACLKTLELIQQTCPAATAEFLTVVRDEGSGTTG